MDGIVNACEKYLMTIVSEFSGAM